MTVFAATLLDRTTGRARFASDLVPDNVFIAGMARSPYGHARVKNIDSSETLNIPGVIAVLTPADRFLHGRRECQDSDLITSLPFQRFAFPFVLAFAHVLCPLTYAVSWRLIKSTMCPIKRSAASNCMQWPTSSITVSSASGIALAIISEAFGGQ